MKHWWKKYVLKDLFLCYCIYRTRLLLPVQKTFLILKPPLRGGNIFSYLNKTFFKCLYLKIIHIIYIILFLSNPWYVNIWNHRKKLQLGFCLVKPLLNVGLVLITFGHFITIYNYRLKFLVQRLLIITCIRNKIR